MHKIRIVFEKQGDTKFISHLDLVRLFQRAFRRAGIDISYSQGFNPHPKMSISHPLPVGITSNGELMDIQVDDDADETVLVDSLNCVLPKGIRILTAKKVTEENLKSIRYAIYTVLIDFSNKTENFEKKFEEFLKLPEIIISKKTKRGVSDTDIKELIAEIKIAASDKNSVLLEMILACYDSGNLKPSSVLDAMSKYISEFNIDYATVNRASFIDASGNKIT